MDDRERRVIRSILDAIDGARKMLTSCPQCGVLFETTAEEANSPDRACLCCHRAARDREVPEYLTDLQAAADALLIDSLGSRTCRAIDRALSAGCPARHVLAYMRKRFAGHPFLPLAVEAYLSRKVKP